MAPHLSSPAICGVSDRRPDVRHHAGAGGDHLEQDLVKDADAPKEWADLFDPKWKGKVALNTPWRSISVQQLFAYWDKIGIKDAAERMKANEVRFFEGSSGIIQAVIRGDAHVAHITDIPLNGMLADGAPVGFTYPESGTTTSDSMAGVALKAPHPNVGRVFVNWLMSKDGQAVLVDQGGSSGRARMRQLCLTCRRRPSCRRSSTA